MSDEKKFKVMVGANLAPETKYYRAAGLCFTEKVEEHEVTAAQAVALYLDPRIIKASIPKEAIESVLSKKEPPADPKDAAIQSLGAAGAAAKAKLEAAESELNELRAKVSKLEREKNEREQRDGGRKQRVG